MKQPESKNFALNIPLIYAYSVLIKRVSMPIIVIYFLSYNLSFTQIGLLATVMALINFSTNIHGGIYTDLNGTKKAMAISAILGLLTMFFYWIGSSFEVFLLASVCYGFSGTFIGGTRNALLYETLRVLKKPGEFKKYNGRQLLYSHLINAAILLAIPVLYVFDKKLPFLIGMAFFAAAFLLTLFLNEPRVHKVKKNLGEYNKRLIEAFKEVFSKKRVLFAVLLSAITYSMILTSSEYNQPVLNIAGLPVILFGAVYSLKRVTMALSGDLPHRIEKKLGPKKMFWSAIIVVLLGLTMYSFTSGILLIIAVLLMSFAEGFNRVVMEDEVNQNIGSKNRTTILSITNASSSALNAVLVLLAGIAADALGVQQMFLLALIAFAVITGVTYFLSASVWKTKESATRRQST